MLAGYTPADLWRAKAAAPEPSGGGPGLCLPQTPMPFFYVYILQSESAPNRFYVGLTDDLRSRLKKHNNGGIGNAKKQADEANKKYIAILFTKAACWMTFILFLVWAWATR
jgi:hypothetical protein